MNKPRLHTPSQVSLKPAAVRKRKVQHAQLLQQQRVFASANAGARNALKQRLHFLDGVRGALVAYVCVGHFIACVSTKPQLLALLGQVNVAVGGVFAVSGYAAMYSASDPSGVGMSMRKVEPCIGYTARRIASFYPLHLFVLLLFLPFLTIGEMTYNSISETVFRLMLNVLLLQSWFPMRAESFNSPTWFLSALGFALLVLPYALQPVSRFSRKGLRLCIAFCAIFSAVCKVSYSLEVPGSMNVLDSLTSGKLHPNLLAWNATRFSPFQATLEVIAGAAAARLPLLDRIHSQTTQTTTAAAADHGVYEDDGNGKSNEAEEEETPQSSAVHPPGSSKSALLPLALVCGLLVLRAFVSPQYGVNDAIARSVVFLPLFLSLLVRLHRLTDAGLHGVPSLRLTSNAVVRWLGTLSFPLFIVHAPLGQLLYKRAIASKLWGRTLSQRPFVFFCWMLACVSFALVAHKCIVQNKRVQAVSENVATWMTSLLSSSTPERSLDEANGRKMNNKTSQVFQRDPQAQSAT